MQDIEILIPTFNEEKNLPITIKSLNENGFYNITVVDWKSKDNTVKVAKEKNCKVLIDPEERMGFGYSVINATCEENNDGSITTNVAGGTMPYGYFWSNGLYDSDLYSINGFFCP